MEILLLFDGISKHWGWRQPSLQVSRCFAKWCEFNIIRPVQDIIKPTKAVWKTESCAGPGANSMGTMTEKFCWKGPVKEGLGGNCGLKGLLKRTLPNAWPGGKENWFRYVHENSPITTPSGVVGVHGEVAYKINVNAVWVNQPGVNLCFGQLVL